MGYRKGEIYEYYMTNGQLKYAIVVSSDDRENGRYINVIVLTDEPKGQITVPVVCRGKMYADCGMVSFAVCDRIGDFVRTATEFEVDGLNEGIAKSLGIIACDESEIVENLKIKLEKTIQENRNLRFTLKGLEENEASTVTNKSDDIIRIETERDLYKNLYEQIFSKMIER